MAACTVRSTATHNMKENSKLLSPASVKVNQPMATHYESFCGCYTSAVHILLITQGQGLHNPRSCQAAFPLRAPRTHAQLAFQFRLSAAGVTWRHGTRRSQSQRRWPGDITGLTWTRRSGEVRAEGDCFACQSRDRQSQCLAGHSRDSNPRPPCCHTDTWKVMPCKYPCRQGL
ncbi:Hypothetical predicted protein [Pelobates cultripes]|uniref:Uncharacterized protein n=1 Tax=Pelobates cultripes TaxID=61616 RepID=A0AAD1T0E8_PELCU|nr:Hypothetical predicted protein [Pelobates cultripes]